MDCRGAILLIKTVSVKKNRRLRRPRRSLSSWLAFQMLGCYSLIWFALFYCSGYGGDAIASYNVFFSLYRACVV